MGSSPVFDHGAVDFFVTSVRGAFWYRGYEVVRLCKSWVRSVFCGVRVMRPAGDRTTGRQTSCGLTGLSLRRRLAFLSTRNLD
ncbi:hypothetical protein CDAR_283201 [Caerostris darwini]|uniref:Uncharacterized protein n=1 Tax=Caerostris darwini TaxID=1538125 RepID=A0AAV4TYE2_9ARAC|nr:hypothetical protein CDAR_283201 [Caerostris darwini]